MKNQEDATKKSCDAWLSQKRLLHSENVLFVTQRYPTVLKHEANEDNGQLSSDSYPAPDITLEDPITTEKFDLLKLGIVCIILMIQVFHVLSVHPDIVELS